MEKILQIDGINYELVVHPGNMKNSAGIQIPVLCIVSYLPNTQSVDLIKIAVESIRKFTDSSYSLWVVDNNSPNENLSWLREQTDLTLVENHTPPKGDGSYANALALEICAKLIPQETKYFMSLHQDIMFCKRGWLDFLLSHFSDSIRAVGVREDVGRVPEGVLHVLGYIIDFQIFKQLGLHYFPDLPSFDTGDKAIIELRKAGYAYYATKNTLHDKEILRVLPAPLSSYTVDMAIDDEGDVFFMHLGRGVLKSHGDYQNSRGKALKDWRELAHEVLQPFPSLDVLKYASPKLSSMTFRRWHLDAFLGAIPWRGRVLDIGGRKGVYRGDFRPPFDQVTAWEYVNINPEVSPDYLASADALPLSDGSIDCVLMSETLEHLEYPEKAIYEAYRVMKVGGVFYALTPFLFPVHADPDDYQRWLPSKYKSVFKDAGFSDVKVLPMGGLFSVVYDFILIATNAAAKNRESKFNRRINRYILPKFSKICERFDKKYPWFADRITTGYYVEAIKK